jgi:glucose-6-phosphate isomerase
MKARNTCIDLKSLSEWQALEAHYQAHKHWQLRDYFQHEPLRFNHLHWHGPGMSIDFSHHAITTETLDLLHNVAKKLDVQTAFQALIRGEKINNTEDRAAWHTALRAPLNSSADWQEPAVAELLTRMEELAELIRAGNYLGSTGKPIRHIVNIGIGGSDLGPKMACYALQAFKHADLNFYFVSNLDGRHLQEQLRECDPETTLFIIVSKTFTTRETLVNYEAAKAWLMTQASLSHDAISLHWVAVTAAPERAEALGFSNDRIFPFWDWVGGRYSLWSAVGLSLMIAIGSEAFRDFLAGAHAMDRHALETPLQGNLPIMLALLSVWYGNFWGCQSEAVIPYYQGLELLPNYLQQLCMESLGKSVRRDGSPVDYTTGSIIWGGAGTNTQHSFHQLLLQGTHRVPIDFILPLRVAEQNTHQAEMLAHGLAQSEVFAFGYTPDGATELCSHQRILGNQPHSLFLLNELSPYSLGALIALYEHKVYAQSVIWQINPFDQWGVQRAKVLTADILASLLEGHALAPTSPSDTKTARRFIAEKLCE